MVGRVSEALKEGIAMERSVRAGLFCWGILLLVGLRTSARAQTFQGSLTGTVTDPSGAIIVGVQVTAVEQATGFSRSATTGDDGSYSIVLLPPRAATM